MTRVRSFSQRLVKMLAQKLVARYSERLPIKLEAVWKRTKKFEDVRTMRNYRMGGVRG